jgi:hypothetical protein
MYLDSQTNLPLLHPQTVMHLHIHLIPRYAGDQPDPRGGVRWINDAESMKCLRKRFRAVGMRNLPWRTMGKECLVIDCVKSAHHFFV